MNIKDELLRRILTDKDIGNFLPMLHDRALDFVGPEILEFGTWKGSSSIAFLNAIEKVGGHLTSLDIKSFPIAEKLADNHADFLIQDSRTFESDKQYDIILVDSYHNYKQVKAECLVIDKIIKEGTIIFFHDPIYKPEIQPAINEFISNHKCTVKKYPENKGMWEVEIL